MSTRPPSLHLVADRRIQEAASQGAPALDVRGPISKTMGKRAARTPERAAGAGLTRRERRVQEILLKELETMNSRDFGGGLSYNEIQKLKKTLDVDYIDAELATMETRDRWIQKALGWVGIPVALAAVATATYQFATGQPFDALFPTLYAPLFFVSLVVQSKSNKRRRWIYQALRELSDAEDEDVQLPESVALADLLIDRIVAQEASAARMPLHRIRS